MGILILIILTALGAWLVFLGDRQEKILAEIELLDRKYNEYSVKGSAISVELARCEARVRKLKKDRQEALDSGGFVLSKILRLESRLLK